MLNTSFDRKQMINKLLHHSLARFLAVGLLGFGIEAGLLFLCYDVMGIDSFLSRFISFPPALIATYILNKFLTFRSIDTDIAKEIRRYTTVQLAGFMINFSLYSFFMLNFNDMTPLFALSASTLCSMVFTYFSSKHFVFNKI